MKDQFWVLRDEDGFYRPQVFICRETDHSEADVAYYRAKHPLQAGEDIVKVVMKEI